MVDKEKQEEQEQQEEQEGSDEVDPADLSDDELEAELDDAPEAVKKAMGEYDDKKSSQDEMTDNDYMDIIEGRRPLESNTELRQLYKYCMVNYLHDQYPGKIFHLQMLGKSLLSLERFSKFLKRMAGEEEYDKAVRAMNKQGVLNRYVNNLISTLSSLSAEVEGESAGEKRRKGLNKIRSIVYTRLFEVAKHQNAIDGSIINALMILIHYSDLRNVPLPDRDVLADNYRLSFDDEERRRLLKDRGR